jgi:hypothetical protein
MGVTISFDKLRVLNPSGARDMRPAPDPCQGGEALTSSRMAGRVGRVTATR